MYCDPLEASVRPYFLSARTKFTSESASCWLILLLKPGMLPRTFRPFMIELKMRSSLTSSCHCASAMSRAWLNLPFEVLARPSEPWHETQYLRYTCAAGRALLLVFASTTNGNMKTTATNTDEYRRIITIRGYLCVYCKKFQPQMESNTNLIKE